MSTRFRSLLFVVAIYAAFFASGAACLVAEVTWNRMLIVVVGNSLSATALIVAVFMGGLGFGSYVGGKVFGKRAKSLVPYVLLELGVGAYVLLSPALLRSLSAAFTSLAESIDNQGGLTALRLVVTICALFVPASVMGATFPAIISGTAPDSPAQQTVRTGYLYSFNTLGAAIGCFAAGYHLLFEFGVQTTLNCAFALYVFAALAAAFASRVAAAEAPAELIAAPSRASDAATPAPRVRRFLFAATFAVGFVALAYELILTRLGILYLGNAVSVFALVLTGFLIGTGVSAIGSTWLYGLLQRHTSVADRLFGVVALVAGVFVLVPPYLLLTDWVMSAERFARFADASPMNPLPVLAVIIAPTVLIGGLLPIAIRMFEPDARGEATRGAATLYAVNTAGALIGAGVANHYLVPLFGSTAVISILTATCVAVGVTSLAGNGKTASSWAAGAVGFACTVGLLVAALPGMMELYGAKVAESTAARSAEVKLVVEGRAATVTVIDQSDPKKGTYRDMYLNGVEEASTRFWHVQLFKLLGLYPVLVHESDGPKETLVIAFGAGITAGSVLASDSVSTLDVVDLNPDIEGINDLFTEVNGDVFHKPRFNFHTDDGRNYLVTTNKKYDVIVNDSTHPRAYDSWILYTEEFYRAVARRLRPGGVFAQWVPVQGSMQGELFRIHLNTVRSIFENTTVWYVYGSDQAFLMSTPEPYVLDAARLQGQLDRLPQWFRANEYQLDTVARVTGFFWMDPAAMARMIGEEKRINTDHRHYFDKQSAVRPSPKSMRLPMFHSSVLPHLRGADDALVAAVRREQAVARLVANYGFFLDEPDLAQAFCLMPDNGNARYFLARALAVDEAPRAAVFCSREIQTYRALVKRDPNNVQSLNGLAHFLAEADELTEALQLARRALALQPSSAMVLDTLGWILLRTGAISEAVEALEGARAGEPEHPVVLFHLGAAYGAAGRAELAAAQLKKALELDPTFADASAARELLTRYE